MPTKPGSPTVPVPGYDLHVDQVTGQKSPLGTTAGIVLRLPLPPGRNPCCAAFAHRIGPGSGKLMPRHGCLRSASQTPAAA